MQKDAKGSLSRTLSPGFGYGRSRRLTKRHQFDRVFQEASVRRTHSPLRLLALPNNESMPRLGIVVSKRAMHRAVARNRAKRVIRESFRHEQRRLPAMDIIIQAIPGKDGRKSVAELTDALSQLWKGLVDEA
ncbi:ribonuclease P protein component [Gammaproteobacteria bacterium]|nr:ribonuclease P protein component [Gammaproteobacteria bacterium]